MEGSGMAGTRKKAVEKEPTIEESFAKLEEMVRQMEREDISLEESFGLYEEGMRLLKSVNTRIGEVEEKIRLIDENGQVTGELGSSPEGKATLE